MAADQLSIEDLLDSLSAKLGGEGVVRERLAGLLPSDKPPEIKKEEKATGELFEALTKAKAAAKKATTRKSKAQKNYDWREQELAKAKTELDEAEQNHAQKQKNLVQAEQAHHDRSLEVAHALDEELEPENQDKFEVPPDWNVAKEEQAIKLAKQTLANRERRLGQLQQTAAEAFKRGVEAAREGAEPAPKRGRPTPSDEQDELDDDMEEGRDPGATPGRG